MGPGRTRRFPQRVEDRRGQGRQATRRSGLPAWSIRMRARTTAAKTVRLKSTGEETVEDKTIGQRRITTNRSRREVIADIGALGLALPTLVSALLAGAPAAAQTPKPGG